MSRDMHTKTNGGNAIFGIFLCLLVISAGTVYWYLDNEQKAVSRIEAKKPNTEQIKETQQKLKNLGFKIAVDGQLGDYTKQAIAQFYRQQNLPSDNEIKINSALINALDSAITNKNAVSRKSTSKQVQLAKKTAEKNRQEDIRKQDLFKSIDAELKRLAYPLPTNNLHSTTPHPSMRMAITRFVTAKELKLPAVASKELLAHLKAAKTKPQFKEGQEFSDCQFCPEMIVIPAGSFKMGSNNGYEDETPVHKVTIKKPFAMGIYELTWRNYQPCIDAGECQNTDDEGWGRKQRPVINVNWHDIQTYITWLNQKTGNHYSLPTEAEWEYAARAKSTRSNHRDLPCSKARYGYHSNECGKKKETASVGSYKANRFGLFDIYGNVQEWVEDCSHDTYQGAPNDGSAWTNQDCIKHVLRGGAWYSSANDLRPAYRGWDSKSNRHNGHGFRLVLRDL
jgi:formylglycine-generating enzyme required for sulfatase activity